MSLSTRSSTRSEKSRPRSATFSEDIFQVITNHRLEIQTDVPNKLEVPEVSLRKKNSTVSNKSRHVSTQKIAVSVIDEDKVLETTPEEAAERFERNNSVTTSAKNPYRKSNRSEREKSKPTNGIVNGGYSGSRTPSIYNGSLNSLPVVREQYCSCTRWSKMEKILICVVAVLSLVIICLLVVVGVLADNPRKDKPYWSSW